MKDRFNLKDFREKINLYLDNQLSPQDQEILRGHADKDPNIGQELSREQNFRKFIKNNVKRPTMPPDFAKQIRNRLDQNEER